jgi:iron complex transport system substrate-binding protein
MENSMSLLRGMTVLIAMLGGVGSVFAQEFPQVFEHRFGSTTLETRPERVVTLTFSGQDHYLALGVKPVGTRDWYGDFPYAAWPWAQEVLGDGQPVLFKDISYEQIAALEPDVIEGIGSGMTEEQYVELSKIAPTIAAEAQYTDYSTPWAVRARTVGRIVGEADRADAIVSALEQRFTDVAANHPDWAGMEAAVAFNVTEFGVYHSIDTRAQILGQLGFKTPAAIDATGEPDAFWVPLSEEQMALLDTDLVVWIVGAGDPARIAGMPMRDHLDAAAQGREVVADFLLSGAFSFATPLSLNYMLDRLVPLIEVAVDGDPSTVVETSAAAGLLD